MVLGGFGWFAVLVVTQVHDFPMLEALLFQSFCWISATRFAELIQF